MVRVDFICGWRLVIEARYVCGDWRRWAIGSRRVLTEEMRGMGESVVVIYVAEKAVGKNFGGG
jgi:hypothetical protein